MARCDWRLFVLGIALREMRLSFWRRRASFEYIAPALSGKRLLRLSRRDRAETLM